VISETFSAQWAEIERLRDSATALRSMARRWGAEFPLAASVAIREAEIDEQRLAALRDRYPWGFQ
jgi:hypothetical protein